MSFMDFEAGIMGVLVIVLLVIILGYLITRWFWNWYFKINARLHEQRKTNELLQNIYDALVQGNQVSAAAVGQVMGMKDNSANG